MSPRELVPELMQTAIECINSIWQQQVAPSEDVPPVEEPDFVWPRPDLTDDEWMQVVCHSLEAELNDPREDIYNL
jgi:hypothetical protein